MPNGDATIGYFTVLESERMGWTGGLLVLNRGGRPIEFQCTLPVRPTKVHEILYGATLRQHVIAEAIGPTLLKKVRTPLSLLICDQPESLRLDPPHDCILGLLVDAAEQDEGPMDADFLPGYHNIHLAGAEVAVPMERFDDADELMQAFADFPDGMEPLQRIRDAVKEAHSQLARSQPAATTANSGGIAGKAGAPADAEGSIATGEIRRAA